MGRRQMDNSQGKCTKHSKSSSTSQKPNKWKHEDSCSDFTICTQIVQYTFL